MSYKSHNDLHGLSYCYYADLFKILHCEQLTGIPLPCQLLQPIKLNHWSGKKNQVRGMGNCTIFLSSLYNLSQTWGGFSCFTQSFLFFLKMSIFLSFLPCPSYYLTPLQAFLCQSSKGNLYGVETFMSMLLSLFYYLRIWVGKYRLSWINIFKTLYSFDYYHTLSL